MKKWCGFVIGACVGLGLGVPVYAGAGGLDTAFQDIVILLGDWLSGSLGKVLATATLGVGLSVGLNKGSMVPAVVGAACA